MSCLLAASLGDAALPELDAACSAALASEASSWTRRRFDIGGHRLALRVRSPDAVTVCGDGCDVTGGYVWNEALVLTAYLLHQPPESFAGEHVLELGAGPALPGLALALHACQQLASTTLSDYEAEAMCLAEEHAQSLPASAKVHVRQLDWTRWADWVPALGAAPGLILAAGCVYEAGLVRPLMEALHALLRARRGSRCLLAAVRRRPRTWALFEEELRRRELHVLDRSTEALDAMQCGGCSIWCDGEAAARVRLMEVRLTAEQ